MIPRRKKEDQPEEGQDLLTVFVELEEGSESHRVFTWRRDTLLKAGITDWLADKLAGNPDIDLHRAVELKARGCTDANLLRILW